MEQDATLVEPFTREDVMKRTVPWRNYAEAGLITAKDLELITEFDKKEPDVQQDMLSNERKGKKYVTLLFTVLGKINTVEPLQYVVALLNELVDGSTDRVLALYTEVSKTMDIYTPLFSAIRRVDSDWFLNKEASNLLRLLLCHPDTTASEEAGKDFLEWIKTQLQSKELLNVMIVVGVLRKLLLVVKYRDAFGPSGLPLLQAVASENIAPLKFQLLYEVCMCIWLCLYNKELAATPAVALVATLASITRQIAKEKVRRMSVASLRSLTACRENRHAMIACHVEKLATSLLSQKLTDQEYADDLQALQTALMTEITEMSSWDMYRTEVLSGQLDWSPVHRSERFWREYVGLFENNSWEILTKLQQILQSPDSSARAIAVCCFDIGEFARFHPRGKQVLAKFDFKMDLMKLLTHADSEVRKNALFSLQKLMSNKLEYSGV